MTASMDERGFGKAGMEGHVMFDRVSDPPRRNLCTKKGMREMAIFNELCIDPPAYLPM